MKRNRILSPQAIKVLQVLLENASKPRYGRDIGIEAHLTGGSVQTILGRLEESGILESFWEKPELHEDEGRPRRRYYTFTTGGAERARIAIAEAGNRSAKLTARAPKPSAVTP